MKDVKIFIERASDGSYSAYMPDDDGLDYMVMGTGNTVEEAIADIKAAYEGMKQHYVEKGKNFEEIMMHFVKLPEVINVEVHRSDKNFSCVWGTPGFGSIVVTNKTLEGLKSVFATSLQRQINDMLADGEDVPGWLAAGEYEIEYNLCDF